MMDMQLVIMQEEKNGLTTNLDKLDMMEKNGRK